MKSNKSKADTGKRYTDDNRNAVAKLAATMSSPDIARKLRLLPAWVSWQVRLLRNAGKRVFKAAPAAKSKVKVGSKVKPAAKRPLGKARRSAKDDLLN